ncbi:MAG: hypothetical protein JSS82_07055 [Bacteroidetes bacterium]|nr:hypothetical protein [Bacteroidota bacterium]
MAREKKATFEVKLTSNALHNIDEITGYIAFVKQQPLNAVKVGDAIFETIGRIANIPFAYRV